MSDKPGAPWGPRLGVAVGLLVVASAAPVFKAVAPLPPADQASNQTAHLVQRQEKAAGVGEHRPSPSRVARMTFTYPAQLRENQTGVVTLTYRRFTETIQSYATPTAVTRQELVTLDEDLVATLSSAGFTVKPEESLTRAKGQSLPAVFKWTIAPEHEGDHPIVVNVSRLMWSVPPRSHDVVKTEFLLNGADAPLRDFGVVDLPLRVTTRWGVPQTWVTVASGGVGLLGFILAYPIVVAWIKRWLGWGSDDKTP